MPSLLPDNQGSAEHDMCEQIKPQAKSNRADIQQRLCRARKFIDDYYDLPLPLAEISKQAYLSRYHFLRLFRDTFNTTPHQYLIQRRIERAKQLLSCAELSVTEVCFEVGFQSLGSFSTLFRQRVGHSPVSYRARAFAARRRIPGCVFLMHGLPNTIAIC
jgi:AraC-like DNA-binding protein